MAGSRALKQITRGNKRSTMTPRQQRAAPATKDITVATAATRLRDRRQMIEDALK